MQKTAVNPDREKWMNTTALAVIDLALEGRTFSGNDIWETPGVTPPPDGNRRLLGAVLRRLESMGALRRVGWTTSKGGHGQRITLWTAAYIDWNRA